MLTNRTAGGIGAIALILFGVAIGVAADRLWLSHGHGNAAAPHDSHDAALSHLQQMFDLDDAQLAEVDAIFRRHQDVVLSSWAQVEPSLRTAIESVHNSMLDVLHPEQREAFNEWLHEQGRHEIHIIEHAEEHTPPRH